MDELTIWDRRDRTATRCDGGLERTGDKIFICFGRLLISTRNFSGIAAEELLHIA